jgi:hypothetical protein
MAGLSIAFDTASVSGYVQRMSRREKLLGGFMLLVVLVLAPLKAWDWSQSQMTSLTADKAALQAVVVQDNPVQIRRTSRLLSQQRRQVQSWSWRSPSFDVARVLLEQEAAVAAVKAGVANPEVKSSDQPVMVGPARFVRVELSGPFTWPSFSALVQRLSSLGKGYIVDSVSVQSETDGGQFKLAVLMPFVTPDATAPR